RRHGASPRDRGSVVQPEPPRRGDRCGRAPLPRHRAGERGSALATLAEFLEGPQRELCDEELLEEIMFGIGMEFEEAEVAVEPPARHRKKRAELLKELGLELSETKTLGSGRALQDA